MPTRDLSSLFDATIDYPGVVSPAHLAGTTYRVPSPDARTGALLTAQAAASFKLAAGEELTDAERRMLDTESDEIGFYQQILGPVYEQMTADGVAWTVVQAVARDAFLVITDNQPIADAALAAAGEAKAAASKELAAAAKKTGASSKRTAPKTGGSKSKKGSTATPARSRGQGSTPSSTSPRGARPAAEAAAG